MNKEAMMRILRTAKRHEAGPYLFLITELESMRVMSLVVMENLVVMQGKGLREGTNEARAFLLKAGQPVATTALWRSEMLQQNALRASDSALISVMNLCALMYKRFYCIVADTGEEAKYSQNIKEVIATCQAQLGVQLGRSVFTLLGALVD